MDRNTGLIPLTEVAQLVALFLRTAVALLLVLALSAGSAFAQATSTPTPVAATATAVSCVNPPTGVQIILENPQPGDTLISGTPVVINGVAYDTRSAAGSGISSVMVYLGSRDSGGTALGTAVLGQPNPNVSATSPFANAGFTLRTPNLPSGNGGRSIFVYAHSIVDNSEGSLEVPIYLNTAPTPVRGQVPTAVLPTPPACTPTPVPAPTSTPTNTPAPVVASTSTPTPFSTPTPLSISTLPPAPPPVAPAPPAAPAPAAPAPAAPVPVAVNPAAARTTAPNGGGMPTEVGLIVIAVGASIVAGGLGLRRRK